MNFASTKIKVTSSIPMNVASAALPTEVAVWCCSRRHRSVAELQLLSLVLQLSYYRQP
jgi:hypothetical protein